MSAQAPASQAGGLNAGSHMKLLIVDDSRCMRRILCKLLEDNGFHDVDEACDGFEALDRLHADTYDLVLSDVRMAPMSGIDLVAAIRADAALSRLPVVMVTSEKRAEWIRAAKSAGADGYVVKPFDAAMLAAGLAPVLQGIAA